MIIRLIKILKYIIFVIYLIIVLLYIFAIYAHGAAVSYALKEILLPPLFWLSIILSLHLLQKYLEKQVDKN